MSRPMEFSHKSKMILVLCYIFGFYVGAHAFYVGRYKKGVFYTLSLSGVLAYYSYILYKLMHSAFNSLFRFRVTTWFMLFTMMNVILQHVPMMGWVSFFGTYLIYLFALGLLLVIIDGISIIFGCYKDAQGLYVVTRRYQLKKMQKEHEITVIS